MGFDSARLCERYVIAKGDPGQIFEVAMRGWVEALAQRDGWADEGPPPEGLHVRRIGGARLRSAFLPKDNLFAAEFEDAHEAWLLVLAQDKLGRLRCGWERLRGSDRSAPREWLRMTQGVELEPDTGEQGLPDFLGFAALAVAPGVTIRTEVVVAPTSLEAAEHWKAVAKRQAPLLRAQRQALSRRQDSNADAGPENLLPDSLAGLELWAASRADQLLILPRALAEAKRATVSNVRLVYDALSMLADTYVATKLCQLPRDALMRRCRELGLSIGRSVDPSRAGSEGDEYFVTYKGRRRFLESHVGRGTSRDPRYTVRIYFFYDEEDHVVVVGWLPTHLSCSLT
ncbi:hypothetical protein Bpfe_031084 [Biomphalaria pfeifferi]|uniref:Uncharacterized protein n=1 Tax=Biomphalaria pfeifferi TaxID=112525 RepID=A0AAD8ET87_BIOPF|nr:hypothetical protein Bpfe_031084 [Biomphalaria pfeifferi]